MNFPEADAAIQDSITDEQAQFFRDNGFLVVRNAICEEELRQLREDTLVLMEKAKNGPEQVGYDPEYRYRTGSGILYEIGSMLDKCDSMKVLLGHPFILRSVERILGPNFVPGIEEMFFKMPGKGVLVPWHRDVELPDEWSALPEHGRAAAKVIVGQSSPDFNVDIYLDEASLETCLWVIPGSNAWSSEQSREKAREPGFHTDGAVPIPMRAGDMLFHDVLIVHGSKEGRDNPLRRTQYFSYSALDKAYASSGHTWQFVMNRQMVVHDSIDRRAKTRFGRDETPYRYAPTDEFATHRIVAPYTYQWPNQADLIPVRRER